MTSTVQLTDDAGNRLVSNSEIGTFKRCRRKWWLRYYRGLIPRRDDPVGPRALGTNVHEALFAYYDPEQPGVDSGEKVLALWDKAVAEAVIPDEFADEFRKESDLGRAMLEGYFEWLAEEGADADWRVLSAEVETSAILTNHNGPRPVRLIGKFDLTLENVISSARAFMDHKTVQNVTDLPAFSDIDEQFQHYSLIDFLNHLAEGDDAEQEYTQGGVYNMLRKVKRTARATPPFYKRTTVSHNPHRLRSYFLRLSGAIGDMQKVEDALDIGGDHRFHAYPTPLTRRCQWDCDYRAVCPLLDDETSRAEDMLAEQFEEGDALKRYETFGADS